MSRLERGGLIDRSKPISFTFDGIPLSGFAGDTLASALVANSVKLVGRSFKYHRPRGILTAGSEEPNALVTVGKGTWSTPNSRATTVELFTGLEATSQNRWPNLAYDVLAVNQLAAPLFVAGFYYKTFMWPASFWEKVYEPLIRRAAGLGRLPMTPDPTTYDRGHIFSDLLIVGAGPSGLAAALTAGRAGLRVVLAEEDWRLGGALHRGRNTVDRQPALDWVDRAAEELATLRNVTILRRTTVFGAYDGSEYGALQSRGDPAPQTHQRLWKIVAKRCLLCTGAIERPLVFAGNDRPNVMMSSAVATYVSRFAASPGQRVAVFTTTDSGWATADRLIDVGVEVAAVVDARKAVSATVQERVRRGGVRILTGAVVQEAHGRPLEAITLRLADKRTERLNVDCLAVSGGWNPAIGLGGNMGHKPVWSETIQSYVLDGAPPGMTAAGAASGRFSLHAALETGVQAAAEVVSSFGRTSAYQTFSGDDEAVGLQALWHIGGTRRKAFVDFQHDVTDKDVAISVREGFVSVEHLKRYTTLGMATDQGKTSAVNGNALLARETRRAIAEVGTIVSRAPNTPIPIGAFAGLHREAHFRPVRRTASHDWAEGLGATFVDVGQWKRAQWFSRPGETDWLQTVCREVETTRSAVGICDVSTLGKIDIHGPDAARLLDRLYINTFSSLPVGRARYGVMLREDGFVFDDGTTTRFADDRFFLTTTTANAARVMQHIDFARQVLWPGLDVQATSVTEQWATYAVAGPKSRALLQAVLPHLDLSNGAVPYMAALEFEWRGASARLFRVSFSGELAFEVAVPATRGETFLRELMLHGEAFGACAYGTEALGVMRIEKGHPAGNELNGQTTPRDLGLERMLAKRKDYIGKHMLDRPALTDPARSTLIGLRPLDPKSRLGAGSQLLGRAASPSGENVEGYVTSVAYSPSVGSWIGLGLLSRGADRLGESVRCVDLIRGRDTLLQVCSPVFVDPEGERLRG